jgi:F-type H+-transporting ATPase subunit b
MIKRIITFLLVCTPLALFAAEGETNYDIVERTVNFFIFAAIIYYLLADKLKSYFKGRTEEIQGELNKVQEMVKESEKKVADAKKEVENAQKIANELVASAKSDTQNIKSKIEAQIEQEIEHLSKSFDAKTELETRKLKKEVVEEVLEELLSNENMNISQADLTNIVLKKVA